MKLRKKIILDNDIIDILECIHDAGYRAMLVGGCLRDILIGRSVVDYDIAVSAQPYEILRLFKSFNRQGEKYGSVSIISNEKKIEITTFRTESNYKDFRHPGIVEFVKSAYVDSKRRDFTINALYYDGEFIYDYHNGMSDLNSKLIRSIGNPDIRFKEDALRILRMFRFAAQLGFKIEKNTFIAAKENSKLLDFISSKSITDEFKSILLSTNTDIISNTFNIVFNLNINSLYLNNISLVECRFTVRLAAALLAGGLDINMSLDFISRLCLTKSEKSEVINIIKCFYSSSKIKRQLYDFSLQIVKYVLEIKEKIFNYNIKNQKNELSNIFKNNECYNKRMLAISGDYLKKKFDLSGRIISNCLDAALEYVMENPDKNTEKDITKYIEGWIAHEKST